MPNPAKSEQWYEFLKERGCKKENCPFRECTETRKEKCKQWYRANAEEMAELSADLPEAIV